ncbi:MAG: hypothetical protein IPN76_05920 [Saprospiraceae bacterium]|nr:hypothetical protein [Saprospiraceae bacterium]
MEDQKLMTAIITSSIALLLGLVNLIFGIISLKSRNKNEREVEKLKSELEKEKIRFEETIKKEGVNEVFKSETTKRILNVFQVLKDNSYSLINNLNQSEEQYIVSLENYKLSLSSAIGVYQATYMDINEELRHEIHEIKNILHYARINAEKEILKVSKKVKGNDRFDKNEIENLIGKISVIQNKIFNNNE